MPPRLLDERALAPLPPPQALDERDPELPRDEEPPKSRLELEPPKSRLDELPPMSRFEVPAVLRVEPPMSRVPPEPPRSRVPALAEPALRDPARVTRADLVSRHVALVACALALRSAGVPGRRGRDIARALPPFCWLPPRLYFCCVAESL